MISKYPDSSELLLDQSAEGKVSSFELTLKIIGQYTYRSAMNFLDRKRDIVVIKGYKVRTRNPRYTLFQANKTCVWCGTEIDTGLLVAREDSKPGDWATFGFVHLESKLVFTKDHIMPRKRGGPDADWNYQTMCQRCNQRKGHGHPHSDRFDHRHKPYTTQEKKMELFLRDKFGH